MWFVTEQHSAELGELGRLHGDESAQARDLKELARALQENAALTYVDKWRNMSAKICTIPL
jgi:hypothetical protein